MHTRHAQVNTTLGSVTIVANNDAIARLFFRHHVRPSEQGCVGPEVSLGRDALLGAAASQLHEYLMGHRRAFDLPLDASGDAFQHAVWDAIGEIPFGETATCSAIAQRLGKKAYTYRIRQAIAANPLCILIPCHRVLGMSGEYGGHAHGNEKGVVLRMLEAYPQRRIIFTSANLAAVWSPSHAVGWV